MSFQPPNYCELMKNVIYVRVILFTILLVHLFMRISPHHSLHLRSHHLSLPLPFTPDLKLISFINPFLHSPLIRSRRPSRISNLYWTKWAQAFVCFSFFFLFFLATCVRLSWSLSFWVHVICLLSYRIVSSTRNRRTSAAAYRTTSSYSRVTLTNNL